MRINSVFLIVLAMLCGYTAGYSQAKVWVEKSAFTGSARSGGVSFAINNIVYAGLGKDASGVVADFYKYDPAADQWSTVASFPGAARREAVAFVLDGIGYVGLGDDGQSPVTYLSDFYKYDPATDSWSQVADFGGTARTSAVSFAVNGKGYVGTGRSAVNYEKDFWSYDPTTNSWVQIADLNADKRSEAVAFAINGKGYVSGGLYIDAGTFQMSDVQEYDPATGLWTERIFADGIKLSFNNAVAFAYDGIGYICYGNKSKVVSYDPVTNAVTDLGDVLNIGTTRFDPIATSTADYGFLGLGSSSGYVTNFYRYGLPDPPPAPDAPSGLYFATTATSISLRWTDNSTDETGFEIERAIGTGGFESIATVAANDLNYIDGDLLPGTSYTYRVRAFNGTGSSAYSNEVTHLTPNTAPSDIQLITNTITKGVDTGTIVGNFRVVDSDVNDQFAVTLTAGNGLNDADNNSFSIDGIYLKTAAPIEGSKESYAINVTVTDIGGESLTKSFTVFAREPMNESKIFTVSDDFESILAVGYVGSGVDTLLQGMEISDFVIDKTSESIYYFDNSNETLYRSDYSGNREKLVAVNAYINYGDIVLDDVNQVIYFYYNGSSIYKYDIVTEALSKLQITTSWASDLALDKENQVFYYVQTTSGVSELYSYDIASDVIANYKIENRSIVKPKVDAVNGKVFFVSRETGTSLNDLAGRMAYLDVNSKEISDVTSDIGVIWDFDIDPSSQAILLSHEPAFDGNVDVVNISYTGSTNATIYNSFQRSTSIYADAAAKKVYWKDGRYPEMILRANYNGTALETVTEFEEAYLDVRYGIANNTFYLLRNGSLKSGPLTVNTTLTDLTESVLESPNSLVYDEDRGVIYWTDYRSGNVNRLDIYTKENSVLANVTLPENIHLDTKRGKLYWKSHYKKVHMANLDGSGIQTIVDVQSFDAYTVDPVNNTVYYGLQSSGGQVVALDLADFTETIVKNTHKYSYTMSIDPQEGLLFELIQGESFGTSLVLSTDISTGGVDTVGIVEGNATHMHVDTDRKGIYVNLGNKIVRLNYAGSQEVSINTPLDYIHGFDIHINNSVPTGVSLSSGEHTEMLPAGTGIGAFSTTDADAGDVHQYSLHPDSPNLDAFTIAGDSLYAAIEFDFETKSSYDIKVVTKDFVGDTLSAWFTIQILDSIENHVPSDIIFTQENEISNLSPMNTIVGSFQTVDTDTFDEHVYSLAAGELNNDLFRIEGNQLILTSDLELFGGTDISFTVTTTDTGENTLSKQFDLSVLLLTSIDDQLDGWEVYPVPVEDVVYVNCNDCELTNAVLLNTAGQVIKRAQFTGYDNSINLSDVAEGIYILKVTAASGQILSRTINIK